LWLRTASTAGETGALRSPRCQTGGPRPRPLRPRSAAGLRWPCGGHAVAQTAPFVTAVCAALRVHARSLSACPPLSPPHSEDDLQTEAAIPTSSRHSVTSGRPAPLQSADDLQTGPAMPTSSRHSVSSAGFECAPECLARRGIGTAYDWYLEASPS